MKNKRGITLIALVITIIVLLILAGIAINAIAGEDGILTKATQAKNTWNSAVGDEEQDLENLNQLIDSKLPKDWEAILEEANNNPEKYIHPEQSNTNGDIGIGTDGKPVNMDLWYFQVIDDLYIQLCEDSGCYVYPGYQNENIVDGKIQGKVPQYIKKDGTDYFLPVTDMYGTFARCTNLIESPILPNIVEDMTLTFSGCENLEKIANFPLQLKYLCDTFYKCKSLKSVPKIPESVTSMYYTFYRCTNLKTVPNLPSNLTDMRFTFGDCTNLETVPPIPNMVTDMTYTFYGCTNLTGTIEINATPERYDWCFTHASTAEEANLVILSSSKSENLDALLATKSANSNITRE